MVLNKIEDMVIQSHNFSSEPPADSCPTVAVAYGVDDNFIAHAGVSIMSIIETTKDANLHFHIVTNCDNKIQTARLGSLVQGTPHKLSIFQIRKSLFELFPTSTVFSDAIYFRLLAPHLIKDFAKILYLDADIVSSAAFTELFSTIKLGNKVCAVVKETSGQDSLATAINIEKGKYFNSGVMLINSYLWVKENISAKTLEILELNAKKFKYFDQDALNVVLEGKVLFLDEKYNTIHMLGHSREAFNFLPKADVKLLHFAGKDKPWQIWNNQASTKLYFKYYKRSPWKDIDFSTPVTSEHLKKLYKCLWFDKKYFPSTCCYIKYQWKKLFSKRSARNVQ